MSRYVFKTAIVEQLKMNQACPYTPVSFFPYTHTHTKIKIQFLPLGRTAKVADLSYQD